MVDCCSALRKAGFSTSGREQLYSGVTGEPLDGMAFVGYVQYQRLRHMVVDKFHARALGPVNQLVHLCASSVCFGCREEDAQTRDSRPKAVLDRVVCASVRWNGIASLHTEQPL